MTNLHHILTSAPALPQVGEGGSTSHGKRRTRWGWRRNGGPYIAPQSTPSLKAVPTEWPEGPQGAAKLTLEKKVGAAGVPSQAPPIGLSEGGGSEGWNCPLLPRALTPGKEAAYPSLISAGNVGGTEGSSSPPSTFLSLPRSLIPSCPYPYR